MSKKVFKYKNSALIITGILSGGIIAGGTFAAIYLSLKTEEGPKKIEYVWREKSILGNSNNTDLVGPLIRQAGNKDTNEYWLSDYEIDLLIDKIKNELGYGPEFFKLRSITLGDENIIGEDSNGLYFPALDQIYINLDNYKLQVGNKFKNEADPKIESKVKVNLIFETIFHEYGHHIANSYLNSEDDKWRDTSIFENGQMAHWNKNFTEKFKEYLNYKNWRGQKYNNKTMILPRDFPQRDIKYKSIGSIYSQQDLFDHANSELKYSYKELDTQGSGVEVLFAGSPSFTRIYQPVEKENIRYLYSMDELFTRKYQLLNEIYKPVNQHEATILGLITPSTERDISSSIPSDILKNVIYYQQGLGYYKRNGYTSSYELGNIKDLIKKPTNAQGWKDFYKYPEKTNRFLYDSPFNNDIYEYRDNQGQIFRLKDHHIDLYNLMDNFLGHADGADISIVWPKNTLRTIDGRSIQIENNDYYNASNYFRFGGYVKSKNYKSIGYMQGNTYKKISNISAMDFTYKHKDWLGAQTMSPLDNKKENIFYVTNKYIKRDSLIGKGPLYFEKEINNKPQYEKLASVRNGKNTGANSSYYPQLYDAITGLSKYNFVQDNNTDVFFQKQGGI